MPRVNLLNAALLFVEQRIPLSDAVLACITQPTLIMQVSTALLVI